MITFKTLQQAKEGDCYTYGCLLHYHHFKRNHKMILIDSSKQQALDIDPKAMKEKEFYWKSNWLLLKCWDFVKLLQMIH